VNYFDIGRAAVLSIALLALSVVVTAIQRSRAVQRLEQAGTR
jgi:multiple sugar transport system permease protein